MNSTLARSMIENRCDQMKQRIALNIIMNQETRSRVIKANEKPIKQKEKLTI